MFLQKLGTMITRDWGYARRHLSTISLLLLREKSQSLQACSSFNNPSHKDKTAAFITAQLKQPTMTMHLSLFLQTKLNPLPVSFCYPCSQPPAGLVAIWKTINIWTYFCRGFSLLWTVSYPAHRNQTFTIHDHISGRESISLQNFHVPTISPNRP